MKPTDKSRQTVVLYSPFCIIKNTGHGNFVVGRFRGNNTLSPPKVNTTKYGLNSFRYFAAKQWNSIPNELRLRAGGLEFNKQVRNIQF